MTCTEIVAEAATRHHDRLLFVVLGFAVILALMLGGTILAMTEDP